MTMSRFVTLVLLLCATLSFELEAQSLCNSTNAIQNGFKLDANVGCSPFTVVPQDQSGLTDVKYIFDYRGQPATELGSLNPGLQDVLFNGANDQPRTYTILQYGKDANGVEKYSCQNLVVRKDNKPKFSYNSCNNQILNITVPDVVENDFDSYVIHWGDNSTESFTSIPYKKTKNYTSLTASRTIKVEGIYNTPIGCSAPSFQTIDMSEGGNYANIDVLKLSEESKKVEIKFDGLNEDYKLFKRSVNEVYDNNNPIASIGPGTIALDVNSSVQYCFSAFRNSGGCFESAGEVCTVPLAVDINGKENVLTWQEHPLVLNTLFGSNGEVQNVTYNIIRSGETIDYFNNVTSPYVDQINCSKEYCYRIETVVKGIPKFGSAKVYESTSLSNEICVDRGSFRPNAIQTLSATFNGDNKHVVKFKDDSNWDLLKTQFYLYTLYPNNDSLLLDSVNGVQDFTTFEIDNSCYRIGYRDECGSISELSPKVCVVNLAVEYDEQLKWEAVNPFTNEAISNYEVYFENENSKAYDLLTNRSNAFNDLSPDLSNFINEARFKVKVLGADGGFSWTNSKVIPLEFKLYLPDAFSPNNDGVNDILEVKGSIGRAESISFVIFDRWGKILFDTNLNELKWDGFIKGKALPIGQYIYSINAELKDGTRYKHSGMLELLK
ncbi:gliding motility-associated C-terminal domain-containing protein [Spirosomataceae bacterium TFI 002]|nr:gliding motility-associated C-terminal domain-containing protein [Spirosomataceae bacterium TFI 002]